MAFPKDIPRGVAAAACQFDRAPARDCKGPWLSDLCCQKSGTKWQGQDGGLNFDHDDCWQQGASSIWASRVGWTALIRGRATKRLLCRLAFVFFTTGATAATVVDFTTAGSYSLKGSSGNVTTTLQPGLGTDLRIAAASEAYPSLTVTPSGGQTSWNLAGSSYVELSVQNIGTTSVYMGVRVDDATKSDEQPILLQAGQSGSVRVYFGYSSGVEGPAVDPVLPQ